tara:strand:+ start:3032 stop:4018 length:987 start_codon:yes stop_codon:yes gene_type:complete
MPSDFQLLSETITKKAPVVFYVYYEEWDGSVLSVANKASPSKHPYITTNSADAKKILLGELDARRFVVHDTVDGLTLMPKSKKLTIKAAEDQLSKISTIGDRATDVNVIFYTNDWKMEVNFNQDTVYRMTGSRHIKKQSSSDEYSKIVLYLIMNNNPNLLVSTFEIDPIDLINNGYKIFDMSHLRTICSLSDVQLLTRRIFKSYSIKFREYYVGAEYTTNKSHKRHHAKIYNNGQLAAPTFVISNTTNGWTIRSNFEDPQEYKIFRDLTLYITDGNPNNLISTVKLPLDKIGWKQEVNFNLQSDINQCRILVSDNIRNITFAQEEIAI